MSTPTPPPGGGTPGLAGALHRLTLQLQAMLHQNQTLNSLPSSARQYLQQARQQIVNPAALLGGQVPPPIAPTAQWLNQTAASFLSQVVLNQPNRGSGPTTTPPAPTSPGPTPPTTPPAPATPHAPMPANPYMWGYPGFPGGFPGGGGGGGYNGPYPGPYPGPLVAPHHSGGGGSPSTGIGSWARHSAPMIGARIAGPWGAVAGAAIAAAAQIPGEIRSQRDKNAYYQSIEGGSNFDGFAERLHEEAYRWTTFGVLSSDEARKAFKGVTKLGYNSKVEGGIGRQEALDFIYHGKTRRGATVDETLQTLQVNSKNALGSLNDLNDALNAVSDSAGKAGINSQLARAEFTQLMDQAIKSGYGSASSGVAALEQNIKSSYGRSFQDVDASGRLGINRAYLAASMTGISVSQYLTSGPTAKGYADSVVDKNVAKLGLKPGVEAWIKQEIARAGGDVNEEVEQQIAEEMLQRFYPNDPMALAATVGSLSGYPSLASDPVKAAAWIVKQYNGKGAAAEVKDLTKADQTKLKETSEKNRVLKGAGEMYRINSSDGKGAAAGRAAMGRDLDKEHEGGFLGFGGENSDAYDAYQSWHKKNGGQEDPVVFALLNAIDGDNKSKVAVSTKSGKKVVSLADAIKRHRNELASGKAVIVEGDHAGKSVKDILGAKGIDPLRDFSKEASRVETSGESFEEWEKDHTKKGKGGSKKLEIGLTAEARRLLAVMDSTGVSGASATASAPQSPWADNPSWQE